MRRYHRVSDLSKEKRDELLRFAQSRILPAGDVFRARLMLALAEGKTRRQIALELHTSRPTIARRKRRFEEQRLAGLDPRHKGSEPRAATPAVQARVLRKDHFTTGRGKHSLEVRRHRAWRTYLSRRSGAQAAQIHSRLRSLSQAFSLDIHRP